MTAGTHQSTATSEAAHLGRTPLTPPETLLLPQVDLRLVSSRRLQMDLHSRVFGNALSPPSLVVNAWLGREASPTSLAEATAGIIQEALAFVSFC